MWANTCWGFLSLAVAFALARLSMIWTVGHEEWGPRLVWAAAIFGILSLICFIWPYRKLATPSTMAQKSDGAIPLPLSRVRMDTIILRGVELLRLADETNKLFGASLIPELSKKERAWLGDISQWLNTKPYLKSEVLGDVFVPFGTSAYDSLRTRITTRIDRINSIPSDEIGT